jgi:hypothetical protein
MLDPRYIAGLFDGEGCVSVCYSRLRYRVDGKTPIMALKIVVLISNTYKPILERLKRTYGGSICRTRRDERVGHKTGWSLRFTSTATQKRFLKVIVPHLIIKRRQAKLGMLYLTTALIGGHRPTPEQWKIRTKVALELKNLNRRGLSKPRKHFVPSRPSKAFNPKFRYGKRELHRRMKRMRNARWHPERNRRVQR